MRLSTHEQNQLSPRFIDLSRIGAGQQAEDGVVIYRWVRYLAWA